MDQTGYLKLAKSCKKTQNMFSVLHLTVAKLLPAHFCQCPEFYEWQETKKQLAQQIHDNAVKEAYQFCKARGLHEVWAYLWATRYSPRKWKLWAQSSSPKLSCLRTTMGMENFWHQLKHNFLHNMPHPRLNQLVWIIINKVIPTYDARLVTISHFWACSCSKPLYKLPEIFQESLESSQFLFNWYLELQCQHQEMEL